MKRAVCFVLLLGLLAVMASPAFAFEYPDASQIKNPESVTLLTDLGLIAGYTDGTFRPLYPITREQIAKLMALFCSASIPTDAQSPFADVESGWSLPYIAYCAQRGLIVGSKGLYRPHEYVTGVQLTKMLLCALGYDGARYIGEGWSENVLADGAAVGLLRGYAGDAAEPISRQDACLLIANALRANALSGLDADGKPIYVLDSLRNPQSYLQYRFGVAAYSGILIANEHYDLENGGKLPEGTSKLKGHAEFTVSTPDALLGQNVTIFMRNGSVFGKPMPSGTDTVAQFQNADALRQVLTDTEYVLSENTTYFLDYGKAEKGILDTQPNSAVKIVDNDGDFVIDSVFLTN